MAGVERDKQPEFVPREIDYGFKPSEVVSWHGTFLKVVANVSPCPLFPSYGAAFKEWYVNQLLRMVLVLPFLWRLQSGLICQPVHFRLCTSALEAI